MTRTTAAIPKRLSNATIRTIVLMWLAWSVIVIGYMQIAAARYAPSRPDEALTWSANETGRRSLEGKPYLLDPFLNTQVAWDSEFYLAIATVGYDDPDVRAIDGENGERYSLSYAFFPFYPAVIRVVRAPFTLLGLTPIAASTAAGVLISLLGTLAALIALADLVRDELGEAGGVRTAFMLLIFPTALFLTSVYTEGLFLGMAFSSLALMRRRHLFAAAMLAALATWTRAIGGALVVPLLIAWWGAARVQADRRWLRLLVIVLPLGAYGLYRLAYGMPFDIVEEVWFGNQLFQFDVSADAWGQILARARQFPETAIVIGLTIASIGLSIISLITAARRYPELAAFGLIALVIPLTSGWTGTHSTIRYVLAVPTIWVALGRWSRHPLFERAWTLASVLLLAMLAFLFSYDFWVA